MIKVKKIVILLLFSLFVLPVNAYAMTGKTELSCDKTSVVPGGIVNCTLTGNVNDGSVPALYSKINTSTNLILKSVKVDSIWEGTNEAVLDLYTDVNKTNTFGIATFTIQASDKVTDGAEEKITIGSTKFYEVNFKDFIIVDDTVQKIKILSSINTLSNIALSEGNLSPEFNSSVLEYSTTINSDKVTISATKSAETSSISGDIGEQRLNYGINKFQINVTSESNVIKTYNISINRPDNRDVNNKLSKLTLNGKNIELSDDKTEYRLEVESDITQLQIETELASSKAGFIDGFEPSVFNLVEGENKFELKIKAENGDIRTYTLSIIRKKVVVDNDNNENNSNGSGSNEKNDIINDGDNKEEIDNPKTGTALFYVVVIITLSTVLIIYVYNKYKKGAN